MINICAKAKQIRAVHKLILTNRKAEQVEKRNMEETENNKVGSKLLINILRKEKFRS